MRCVLRWWWKGKLYRCALTGTYVDCLLVPHAGECVCQDGRTHSEVCAIGEDS